MHAASNRFFSSLLFSLNCSCGKCCGKRVQGPSWGQQLVSCVNNMHLPKRMQPSEAARLSFPALIRTRFTPLAQIPSLSPPMYGLADPTSPCNCLFYQSSLLSLIISISHASFASRLFLEKFSPLSFGPQNPPHQFSTR